MFSGALANLVRNLKKLPGIGTKSASRMAMFLINMDKEESIELANSIRDTVEKFRNCSVCNMLSENDPCQFCQDKSRNDEQLCIVETTQDVYLIEATNEYRGRYFVLGNLLSPIDGIGPSEIKLPLLEKFISDYNIDEIVLALNPSAEGESTINFLADHLADKVDRITRLSTGIPFGGDIEYTSSLTLGNALKRRYEVDS